MANQRDIDRRNDTRLLTPLLVMARDRGRHVVLRAGRQRL